MERDSSATQSPASTATRSSADWKVVQVPTRNETPGRLARTEGTEPNRLKPTRSLSKHESCKEPMKLRRKRHSKYRGMTVLVLFLRFISEACVRIFPGWCSSSGVSAEDLDVYSCFVPFCLPLGGILASCFAGGLRDSQRGFFWGIQGFFDAFGTIIPRSTVCAYHIDLAKVFIGGTSSLRASRISFQTCFPRSLPSLLVTSSLNLQMRLVISMKATFSMQPQQR